MTELEKAVMRWVEAKRQQILREDTKGDLINEVRKQETSVEDAIVEELETEKLLHELAVRRGEV